MKMERNRYHPARTALLSALVLYSSSLHAYLDPSTGSMVVSALVGIFASIALALKTYWYRIRNLLRRQPREKGESSDTPPGQL